MPTIHPTASVSKDAQLADDVEIGPGCTIIGRVTLGAGCRLLAHVHLHGPVSIGPGATIFPGVCVGFPGQDVKFKLGMPTAGVVIGKNCLLREHATIHAATNDHTPTSVGDNCFLMVNAHMGHDTRLGNNVTMVNNCMLAGHSSLGDGVIMGGGAALHQHDRVGRLAFVSGGSMLSTDLPPFCVSWGRNHMVGINLVGLRRAGVPREQITLLRAAYRDSFRAGVQRGEMVSILRQRAAACPPAAEMADFIETSKRTIAKHLAIGPAKDSAEFDAAM